MLLQCDSRSDARYWLKGAAEIFSVGNLYREKWVNLLSGEVEGSTSYRKGKKKPNPQKMFSVFITAMEDGVQCTFRKSEGDTKLREELLVWWKAGLLFKGTLGHRNGLMGASWNSTKANAKSCMWHWVTPSEYRIGSGWLKSGLQKRIWRSW